MAPADRSTPARPLRVFVSSTSADLATYRSKVIDAISALEHQSVAMESFGARPGAPVQECLSLARGCDVLVVILAHRYGWVPEKEKGGDGARSITQMEVEAAEAAEVPVFAFLVDENAPWSGAREESGLLKAATPEAVAEVVRKVQALAAFRKGLEGRVVRETFTNPDDLATKVATSLAAWAARTPAADPATPPSKEEALAAYLRAVVQETGRIDLRGIGSAAGAGRSAVSYPIEELYTPLSIVGAPEERARGRGKKALAEAMGDGGARRVALREVLAKRRRVLLVGAPGSGKTTFLRLVACVLAKDGLAADAPGAEPGRLRHLGLPLDQEPPTPVFVRLADLAAFMKENGRGADAASPRWLLRYLEERYGEAAAEALGRRLAAGAAALLLDGLDEVVESAVRKRVEKLIDGAIARWGENLLVASSRPFETDRVAGADGVETLTVDEFGDDEIREFVARWSRGLHGEDAPASEETYRADLDGAIIHSAGVRAMAKNPVMLTCLCVVHWNERRLPEGKTDLLAAVLRWLLTARDEARAQRDYGSPFAEECFKALALEMTDHPQGKRAIVDLTWAAERLARPFARRGVTAPEALRADGRRLLELEMLDSGVVEQAGPGRLKFWHLTFQEHYAARALTDLGDGEGEDGWWKRVAPKLWDPQWAEVLDHFAGRLIATGWRRADLLVERVLGTQREGDLASTARAVGVLGRLLRILAVYDYHPAEGLGWEKARGDAMCIFEPEGAKRVPVETRIDAAEALGQADDERFTSLEPETLPIPGLAPLAMGRYPVTVCEYRRFVDNGGYDQRDWWDDEGWERREGENWAAPGQWEQQLAHRNRPVVGVSWHEASAYARWLMDKLPTLGELRLPTEKEWEAAATNPAGPYPWGKPEPTPELANYARNVEAPTPVGVYPAGAGPGGHLDLAGNVWEWCSDARERGRALRGGGWFNDAGNLRSEARGWVRAGDRYDDVGFRVLLSPASR